jgi:predicted PurR-regulated permease PerM
MNWGSLVITQFSVHDKGYIAHSREVFIRMALLTLMFVSCFFLLRPFLNLLLAGAIIAVGVFPGYRIVTRWLRGRKNWAAVFCTVLLLIAVIVPAVLLAGTLVDGIRTLANDLQAGRVNIPPLPRSLDRLPVIGNRLKEFWSLCSSNLSEAVSRFSPQIQARIPALLSASAEIGGVVIQFLISIVLSGFLLANSEPSTHFAERVFVRIFGDQGHEFKTLVAMTIRSVTNGILGVAAIQSFLAGLGFWFMRFPGAGLWAVIFLIASVLQLGTLVLVPAALYAFAAYPLSRAVIFLVWCVVVGIMDNILKPVLLGRGTTVPMLVIFLGVLGGFIAMRIIGLFVGAIVLSVGYKLFIAWLDAAETSNVETSHASAEKAA